MMNFGKKMAVGVASAALVASLAGVPAAVAAGGDRMVPSPSYDVNRLRLSGKSRVDTAIEVAKHAMKAADGVSDHSWNGNQPPKVVYIAGYDGEVDAAAGGALTDGPMLLAKADGSSNEKVAEAVKEFGVETVIALGGDKAVPDSVLSDIAKKAGDLKTARVAGHDRFETSVEIANRIGQVTGRFTPGTVVLANGVTLVDALTAGTIDSPILLTKQDGSLPESVMAYLKKVKPQSFIAVGGTKVIPDSTVLSAQYTALGNDALSTDDSYPDIIAKRDRLKALIAEADSQWNRSDGEYVKAVKTAKRLYKEAKVRYDVARADLEKAVAPLDSVKGIDENKKLLDGGKLAANSKVQDVIAKLSPVFSKDAVTADKDVAGKLFKPSREKITFDEAAAIEKYAKDAIKDAKKAIDKYNAKQADGTESDFDGLAKHVIEGDVQTTGVSLYAQMQVFKYRLDAAEANLKSAKDTVAYLDLKAAGLGDKLQGKSYTRLAGKNRYGTAAAISAWYQNHYDPDWTTAVYLVNGDALADAVVAGQLHRGPVLLTNSAEAYSNEVNNEIIRAAKRLGAKNSKLIEIYGVGGSKVISDSLLKTANATALVAQRGDNTNQPTPGKTNVLSANNLTLGKSNTATGLKTKVMLNGVEANPTISAGKILVSDGTNTVASGEIASFPTVGYASGVFTVKATANAVAGKDYTVKFTDDKGNSGSFIVSVTDKDVFRVDASHQVYVGSGANDGQSQDKSLKVVKAANSNATSSVALKAYGYDGEAVNGASFTLVKDKEGTALTGNKLTVAEATSGSSVTGAVTLEIDNSGKFKIATDSTNAAAKKGAWEQEVFVKISKANYEDKVVSLKLWLEVTD
ncbi:hypothetical protein FYZ44_11480 [Mobiluncus mulieris]|nr:cell wall-binding repeat-containing protein [Mobiluncus mulieris]MCU9997444.1 hypothetical protein [Mobiluncus mulieris]